MRSPAQPSRAASGSAVRVPRRGRRGTDWGAPAGAPPTAETAVSKREGPSAPGRRHTRGLCVRSPSADGRRGRRPVPGGGSTPHGPDPPAHREDPGAADAAGQSPRLPILRRPASPTPSPPLAAQVRCTVSLTCPAAPAGRKARRGTEPPSSAQPLRLGTAVQPVAEAGPCCQLSLSLPDFSLCPGNATGDGEAWSPACPW